MIIERWSSWFDHEDYIDNESEYDGTCCLRFIDPYQNTTFNTWQIPVLIAELESLLPKSKSAEARQGLQSLIEFICQAENETHTYIKFVGD